MQFIKKKKNQLKIYSQLKCFLAFLTVMKRYDDYVESVASSHFGLFGAGSSDGSVDKHNLIRIESWTTLSSITLENSL